MFPWVIRRSGWLITRFLIKADGKTPYERLKGREYKGEIVDPLETIHYKIDKDNRGKLDAQTSIGIWLGEMLGVDEHIVGTPQGIRKCRSVWRRPEPRRWEKHRLETVTGTPWQPKGQALVVPGDNKPITIGEGHKARSVYITLERQIEHEPTPGCPGCGACSGTWCGPSHRCRTGSRSRGCCKAKSTALSSTRVDTKASLLYHASSPVTGLLSQRHVPRQRTWAINALRRAEGVDEVVFRAVLTTATDGVLRGSCAPEPGWSSGPAAQLCASGRSITGCAPAPAAAFAFAASAMAALEAP